MLNICFINIVSIKGINHLDFLDGRNSSFFDYFTFYKDNISFYLLNINIQSKIEILKLLNKYKYIQNKYNKSINILTSFQKLYSYNILILDFFSYLSLILYDYEFPKNQKIFITECLELTLFFRNINIPLTNLLFSLTDRNKVFKELNNKNITFLISPYNINDIKNYNYQIYYKKINFAYSPKCDIIYNDTIHYTNKRNLEDKEYFNYIQQFKYTHNFEETFKYKNVIYLNKPYVGYYEQIGRMVFELQNNGNNVIIDNKFKNENRTGLDYYLEYSKNNSLDIKDDNLLEIIQ